MINKILIIEDEVISAKRLKRMVSEILTDAVIDGPLTSVDTVISTLKENNDYDLIFADIQLHGRDVFEAFKEEMPQAFVIFTTAYDNYAMEAIGNNGMAYLLKPIDRKELEAAIDKLNHQPFCLCDQHPATMNEQKSDSIAYSSDAPYAKRRVLLIHDGMYVPVCVDNIAYIYTSERIQKVVGTDGTEYALPSTIKDIEKKLVPGMFFRINRQYLVNVEAVAKICKTNDYRLIVSITHCDEEIIVSRERALAFRKWIEGDNI